MPYGKYKGRLIADLPGHYLNWFAREGFPKGEIGRLLALMHELDHNGLSSLLTPLRTQRSEEHTSELQSLMRISYAVFCLKKKKHKQKQRQTNNQDTK